VSKKDKWVSFMKKKLVLVSIIVIICFTCIFSYFVYSAYYCEHTRLELKHNSGKIYFFKFHRQFENSTLLSIEEDIGSDLITPEQRREQGFEKFLKQGENKIFAFWWKDSEDFSHPRTMMIAIELSGKRFVKGRFSDIGHQVSFFDRCDVNFDGNGLPVSFDFSFSKWHDPAVFVQNAGRNLYIHNHDGEQYLIHRSYAGGEVTRYQSGDNFFGLTIDRIENGKVFTKEGPWNACSTEKPWWAERLEFESLETRKWEYPVKACSAKIFSLKPNWK